MASFLAPVSRSEVCGKQARTRMKTPAFHLNNLRSFSLLRLILYVIAVSSGPQIRFTILAPQGRKNPVAMHSSEDRPLCNRGVEGSKLKSAIACSTDDR